MKKIAIFTLPFGFGYGGILQAFALQTVIERMGYEVEVVQLCHREIKAPHGLKAIAVYFKRLLFKILKLSNNPVFLEKRLNEDWPIYTSQIHQFVREKIHIREVDSFSDLKEGEYDVLVVGSDQVWRETYGDVTRFFFSFAENWTVKRIAYAASFGTSEYKYSDGILSACKPLAKKFDAISVREESGVALCNSYFDLEATKVLDPTMLLKKEDYEDIVKGYSLLPCSGTLFSYILDYDQWKEDMVSFTSQSFGLVPFSIKVCSGNRFEQKWEIQPKVEEWLNAFAAAEFIITDSFHGCVFSILFHKPFLVLANKSRGITRFESLLKTFGLQERLLYKEYKGNLSIFKSIDWTPVDNQLKMETKHSLDFLYESIR